MSPEKKESPCTAGTVTEANAISIFNISESGHNVKPSIRVREKEYPAIAAIKFKNNFVPLVDIPAMSDYRWQQHCLNDRLNNRELYSEYEDVDVTIDRLQSWLTEHAYLHEV